MNYKIEECLKSKQFNELKQFDLDTELTEEIITKYYDNIKEYLRSCYDIHNRMEDNVFGANQLLFNYISHMDADFYLIFKFNKSLITDDFIKENADKMVDYFIELGEVMKEDDWVDYSTSKNNVPSEYRSNEDILKAYIRKNGFTYRLFQFDASLFTEDFVKEYYNQIMEYLDKESRYYIPTKFKKIFQNNKLILNEIVKREGLSQETFKIFDSSFFDEEFVDNYLEIIIDYIHSPYEFPSIFSQNKRIFDAYVEKYKSEITVPRLLNFDSTLVADSPILTDEFLIKNKYVIEDYYIEEQKLIPLAFIKKPIIYRLIIEDMKKNRFIAEQLKNENTRIAKNFLDYADEETRKEYFDFIDIDMDLFKEKIEYLLQYNEDAPETLTLRLLSSDYNEIDIKHLEKFLPYKDIQNKIIGLSPKGLSVFVRILKFLDSSSYDICPIINNFLNHYNEYINLIESIDIENLGEEELHNFLIIIQNPKNYLEINHINELSNENYQQKRKGYFAQIEESIKNNKIEIDTLKASIFQKRFGLDNEKVHFLLNRYCKRIELLDNSGLPKKDIQLLKILHYIYHCKDIEELKFYYIGTEVYEDFYSAISLESKIRKDYAKLYSNCLYKPQEKDKVDSNQFLEDTYEGKKPDFYVLQDDFNLQIYVLGAYSYFEKPENFKTDWERPQINNHGICTSFIGNNQIANARDIRQHPIYGFSSYEGGALLLSGNYDLVSKRANQSYVTSYSKTTNSSVFYDPKNMINFTRHTHNEMVLERRNLADTTSFKRLPNYIVYIVDDIQNKENFSMDNDYFTETIQAANDYNIPIIIVDRLYYAKREQEKCRNLYKQIFQEKEYEKVSDLIVTYMNNIVGCRKYDLQTEKEYHKIFSIVGFNELYNKMIDNMNHMTEEQKKVFLLHLYKAILLEYDKTSFTDRSGQNMDEYYEPLQLEVKLEELKKKIKQQGIEWKKSVQNERINPNAEITKYYFSSDSKTKSLIDRDISNNLSQEAILDKMKHNEYEGMGR